MVRKEKTIIRYRTKRVKARVRHPKTHSILGTFFGAYGLALPFIKPVPNENEIPINYILDHPELSPSQKVKAFSLRVDANLHILWPEMIKYVLTGAVISWIGNKYTKDKTQVSKHWRIM
jgi:hypothetical protein